MKRAVLVGALVATVSCAQLLGFDQDRLASSGGSAGTTGGATNSGGTTTLGGTSAARGGSLPAGEAGQESGGSGGAIDTGGNGGALSGGTSSGGMLSAPNGGSSVSEAGGGGQVSSTGAGAGGEGGAGAPCAGTAGPVMVRVGSYCIDQTEVTNLQYHQFVLANVNPTTVQGCEWKENFLRGAPPVDRESRPVGQVDWCDAKAYCQWAGKRLCGRVGEGPNPPIDNGYLNAAALDEWYRVCSDNGTKKYSYGQSYDAAVCNSSSSDQLPVGTTPTCTAYDGKVFDLLGNTWEWVAACIPDAAAAPHEIRCLHRGGSHAFNNISCLDSLAQMRNFKAGDLGFRCCSD